MTIRQRLEAARERDREKLFSRHRRSMERKNPEGVPITAQKLPLEMRARVAEAEIAVDPFASRRYQREFLPRWRKRVEDELEASVEASRELFRHREGRARVLAQAAKRDRTQFVVPGTVIQGRDGRHKGIDMAVEPYQPFAEAEDAHVLTLITNPIDREAEIRYEMLPSGTIKRVAHIDGRVMRSPGWINILIRDTDGGRLSEGSVIPAGQTLFLASGSDQALHVEIED